MKGGAAIAGGGGNGMAVVQLQHSPVFAVPEVPPIDSNLTTAASTFLFFLKATIHENYTILEHYSSQEVKLVMCRSGRDLNRQERIA